jgi:hypothetical protein
MNAVRVFTLSAALAAVAVAPSLAYVVNGRWLAPSATMRLSAVSFPGASPQLNAFLDAKEEWDLNPSPFRFSLLFNDTSVARGNGQSEVWFSNTMSSPAAAYPVYDPFGFLIEADIIFDADKCWRYTGTPYTALEGYSGGSCRLMEASAVHELGHAAGLAHENDEYNVLGNAWTHVHVNLSTADAYVGEDASAGVVALYGQSASAGEDVSVSHWQYDEGATVADGGQYSIHRRVRLLDTNGNLLGGTTIEEGARRYNVTPGQTIKVELTLENNGASSQSPLVYLVVSNDNWITRFDTLITSRTPTLDPNGNVYPVTYTITLPNNLTPGIKFLGAVLDPLGSITEIDETNNATWIPINVQ